jgi:hypothetical protein
MQNKKARDDIFQDKSNKWCIGARGYVIVSHLKQCADGSEMKNKKQKTKTKSRRKKREIYLQDGPDIIESVNSARILLSRFHALVLYAVDYLIPM